MLRRGAAAGTILAVLAGGCGNGAGGVGACRQIEEARCRRAPSCGISLEPPVHTSGDDVDACIRFYDIACLHGLDVREPSGSTVNACVARIQSSSSDCAIVTNPASDPACAWLLPGNVPTPDASTASAPSPDAALDAAGATDATGD
ncbi:MAG: hypothetical protein FWD17_15110 [Polyangiaceae bacterium]|nr:hypothetical protein [Polyangiaceae bacterium]